MHAAESRDIHPELTWRIVGAAIEVHKALGPGLLEGTYRRCLLHELKLKGLQVASEVPIAITYKGLPIDASYRADLIVENICLLELKAVAELNRVHQLQALTYMRLARLPVGLLINFNVARLKDGIRRYVNFPAG
jgi:GxxExxY protein